MNEQEAYEILIKNISAYYFAISNPKRLLIILELRKRFLAGMKWPELRELTELSSGALKRHIDVLLKMGLIGKFMSYYRVTESGLALLSQVDEVAKEVKKGER